MNEKIPTDAPWQLVVAQFERAGLGVPPAPAGLRSAVRRHEDWLFDSRDTTQQFSMYALHEWVREATSRPVGNYVALGHAGHGLNSYAIHYYLVCGQLALFTQTHWGGVYQDPDESTARVAATLARCAQLIEAYEAAAAAKTLPPSPARLVVVESDFSGEICQWIRGPLGANEELELEHRLDPRPATERALDLLVDAALPGPDPGRWLAPVADPPRGGVAFYEQMRKQLDGVIDQDKADLAAPALPDHRKTWPWLLACAGEPSAAVWFIAENPSLSRLPKRLQGADVTVEHVEAQWTISLGDHLFRRLLLDYGFKAGNDPEAPGGWRSYITDVMKSAYIVKEFDKIDHKALAEKWAPTLQWELSIGPPKLIVAVGRSAERLLRHLESSGALNLPVKPPDIEYIPHYAFVMGKPAGGIPAGDPQRVWAYACLFSNIRDRTASAAEGAERVAG